MSTTATINTNTTANARSPSGQSLFDRLIAARMRQGELHVSAYLRRQSDSTLEGLGFSAGQIAEIRSTGKFPASFWRR